MIPFITTVLWSIAGCLCGWSLVGAWDALARNYVADLAPLLAALQMDQTRIQIFLRWWGVMLLASFIMLGLVFQMLPIAFAAVVLLLLAPRWVLRE